MNKLKILSKKTMDMIILVKYGLSVLLDRVSLKSRINLILLKNSRPLTKIEPSSVIWILHH
jgi:hypothetical protein